MEDDDCTMRMYNSPAMDPEAEYGPLEFLVEFGKATGSLYKEKSIEVANTTCESVRKLLSP